MAWYDSRYALKPTLCHVHEGPWDRDKPIVRLIVEVRGHRFVDDIGSIWNYANPLSQEIVGEWIIPEQATNEDKLEKQI